MTTDAAPTINQLMDLFLLSRNRGEWVKLSMESKDGKDSVVFSLGSPAGASAEKPKAWSPGTTSPPWEWSPMPTWRGPKRKKTPSQIRRDKMRRDHFIAKKFANEDVKREPTMDNQKSVNIIENPIDEIELEKIPEENKNKVKVGDLFKIEGNYKNPNVKPWTKIEPEKAVKALWEEIKIMNHEKGIEEIGEGSTCFEHHFDFWGTWIVKKDDVSVEKMENLESWPKGVRITQVKPA